MSGGSGDPVDLPDARDQAEPAIEGTFAEGLFIPAADGAGKAPEPSEAERLDDLVNGSMPPGGTYS